MLIPLEPVTIVHRFVFLALLSTAMGQLAFGQDEPAPSAVPEPHYLVVRFPQDRETIVAVVGGHPYTLDDLVMHIEERHYPGFSRALERSPSFQRYLTSDTMAPWVRHFADLKALERFSVTLDRDIDHEKLEETISNRLKKDFENYLKRYVDRTRQRGGSGELSQKRVNSLLADFQLVHGIQIEVQGWLDYLAPGNYTREQLHRFFTANARVFGGMVTIEHILVQHRDAGTGILLKPEGRGLAAQRIAEIKARLEPDGSNFAELARRFSDDTKTAPSGGRIAGIRRFDDRLPPELCRAAWALKDGEVSDVVESRYGYHFIKRLEFNQNVFVLFTDDAIPGIKVVMQRAQQEDLLFTARGSAKVELRL